MKRYTEEEIKTKVEEIWSDEYEKPEEVDITITDDDIQIKMSSMYQAPNLSFKILMALADFFETKNINDDDKYSHGGCETCDYGSDYGFTLTVRPEKQINISEDKD